MAKKSKKSGKPAFAFAKGKAAAGKGPKKPLYRGRPGKAAPDTDADGM